MFSNWGIQQQYEKSLELFQEIIHAVAFLQYFSSFLKELYIRFLLKKHKDFQNDWKQILNPRNDQYQALSRTCKESFHLNDPLVTDGK